MLGQESQFDTNDHDFAASHTGKVLQSMMSYRVSNNIELASTSEFFGNERFIKTPVDIHTTSQEM